MGRGGEQVDLEHPPGVIQVAVGSSKNVWALDSTDQVFQWSGTACQKMPGALRNISAANDGTVVGINAQGHVFTWSAK